jgi:hypothetical protein
MASETTKFQINYKLADGTLINIYADNAAELETSLTTIQDTASLITSTVAALGNSGNIQRNIAYATQALGAPQVAPAAPAAAPTGNNCIHGPMTWRESKPGAAKNWKGWFCPTPQGTPDQCSPKFVK